MEGVTPGPWKAEGYVVMGDWHASGGIASVRSGARAFNDAAYIASCNPVAMREVLALARQAEGSGRENAELRKMLERCAPAEQSKSWLPVPLWNDARALLGGENAE